MYLFFSETCRKSSREKVSLCIKWTCTSVFIYNDIFKSGVLFMRDIYFVRLIFSWKFPLIKQSSTHLFHKETNARLKSAHTVNFCCHGIIFLYMHLRQNALKQINLFSHVFQSKEWCGRKSSLSLWDWRGGKRYSEYSDRFFLCSFHYRATPSRVEVKQ